MENEETTEVVKVEVETPKEETPAQAPPETNLTVNVETQETQPVVAVQPISSQESVRDEPIEQIKETLKLVIQKVEMLFDLQEKQGENQQEIQQELRETIDLFQEVIGSLDSAVEKIGEATAALIKLHLVTQKKDQAGLI